MTQKTFSRRSNLTLTPYSPRSMLSPLLCRHHPRRTLYSSRPGAPRSGRSSSRRRRCSPQTGSDLESGGCSWSPWASPSTSTRSSRRRSRRSWSCRRSTTSTRPGRSARRPTRGPSRGSSRAVRTRATRRSIRRASPRRTPRGPRSARARRRSPSSTSWQPSSCA